MGPARKIAVIGGGAAGFFAAISARQHHPHSEVHLFERTSKLLAKVKVSGGGRCNVCHACFDNKKLAQHYPRGERFLRKAFEQFSTRDTIQWFESRGVKLKTEADNRMFPVTDDSATVIDCLLHEAQASGVHVHLNSPVQVIQPGKEGILLVIGKTPRLFDRVVVATGGSPKAEGLQWLENLGQEIVTPVPSLFTFNMPREPVRALMGVSVPAAELRVRGTKLSAAGALLITHWGMSGPAVLRLSAFGARELATCDYRFEVSVNWLGGMKEHELRLHIEALMPELAKRKIANKNPFALPSRLWEYLLNKSGIDPEKRWQEVGKKGLNKLFNTLINDGYEVNGKTTFKEEFVTAGGVALQGVDVQTMQSKTIPGLYFAGEVMDVDGITGGFNFQAAWTTGWIAGKACGI